MEVLVHRAVLMTANHILQVLGVILIRPFGHRYHYSFSGTGKEGGAFEKQNDLYHVTWELVLSPGFEPGPV